MSHFEILPSMMDAVQTAIGNLNLSGWHIHNRELITVMEDTLPAVVVWMLDDVNADEDLSMDGTPQLHKAQMVIELRSAMGATGSVMRTLAPTANAIYEGLQAADPFAGMSVSRWGLRSIQTMGNSDNPKYCGLTMLLEITYMLHN